MAEFSGVQAHGQRIVDETIRAMGEHESMHSGHEAHSVILEEFEEFWDEVKLNPRKMTPDERAVWRERMRKELTQTAAMCLRALVDLKL